MSRWQHFDGISIGLRTGLASLKTIFVAQLTDAESSCFRNKMKRREIFMISCSNVVSAPHGVGLRQDTPLQFRYGKAETGISLADGRSNTSSQHYRAGGGEAHGVHNGRRSEAVSSVVCKVDREVTKRSNPCY